MKRIMIVEDEPLIGGLIAAIIRRMGHEVCGQASTAARAVSLAGEIKPDLLLMDMNLGREMDGFDAARLIIDENGTPVVFISASYDDHTLERVKNSGAYGYVLKPFREQELEIVVTMSLERVALENIIRKSEEELRAAKESAEAANRSKSIFLANMSHELKTPLNALLGYCRLMEMQKAGPLNEKQAEYLAIMQDSGRHLLDVIEDILDVSKIEAGKLSLEKKQIDMVEFLHRFHQSIAILSDRKNIMLMFDISPDLGFLNADEVRLKQVLYNLLSNSIKFTEEWRRVGLDASADSGNIVLSVWDEGPGIPAAMLEVIFRPFEQVRADASVKNRGTGLGLTITKKLVELHGGIITAQSAAGEGSRFTVTLPGRTVK